MTPKIIFYIFLFTTLDVRAQWMEKFDYSDWNTQSNWLGEIKYFTIEGNKLRSNSDSLNTEFYISRSIKLESEMVWEFWVNLKFNTSSANYLDVFLFSDSINLKGQKNGYFVRIGNTKDEIALYKSKSGAAPSVLIDGRDNITAGSNNILKIKVERNVLGLWTLFSDVDAIGSYFTEGYVIDTSFINAKCFGMVVKQSTVSFFNKHFIDDIYVGAPIKDTLSPALVKINVVTDSTIHLVFSEPVLASINLDSCFEIIGLDLSFVLIKKDTFKLIVKQKILAYVPYNLIIKSIEDLNGNRFKDTIATFLYSNPSIPQYKQLLITEIMADPDPSVNLPNAEYIEILNRHAFPIQIKGSTLSDPSKTVILPDFVIQPKEFVIICDNSRVVDFVNYGKVVGVAGLPSLNNTSDEIVIKNNAGELIHKVVYSDKWYQDETKKLGGWSLEMKDTSALCFEDGNWRASVHANGGTPGKFNSINGMNKDIVAPRVLNFEAANEGKITLQFSEAIDSFEAVKRENYKTSGFVISSVVSSSSTVVLMAYDKFEIGAKYSLELESAIDCSGNKMKPVIYSFLMPDTITKGDIVINEILFNPKDDGVDYVELYNRSEKYLDLNELSLGNMDTGASFKNIKTLSTAYWIVAPKSYLLITSSKQKVTEQFPFHDSAVFVELTALPSLNNDKGNIWLITKNKIIIDGMMYDEHMHHGLLKEVDGVSLERINIDLAALNRSNWTSASSNAHYGTPGLKNSQFMEGTDNLNDGVQLSSRVISPDSDGYQDLLQINIAARFAGLNLNMVVLDITGRKVKDLVQNAYLGSQDTFQWDGTNDAGSKLPIGVYLIYVEIWGGEAVSFKFKELVTLGGIFESH